MDSQTFAAEAVRLLGDDPPFNVDDHTNLDRMIGRSVPLRFTPKQAVAEFRKLDVHRAASAVDLLTCPDAVTAVYTSDRRKAVKQAAVQSGKLDRSIVIDELVDAAQAYDHDQVLKVRKVLDEETLLSLILDDEVPLLAGMDVVLAARRTRGLDDAIRIALDLRGTNRASTVEQLLKDAADDECDLQPDTYKLVFQTGEFSAPSAEAMRTLRSQLQRSETEELWQMLADQGPSAAVELVDLTTADGAVVTRTRLRDMFTTLDGRRTFTVKTFRRICERVAESGSSEWDVEIDDVDVRLALEYGREINDVTYLGDPEVLARMNAAGARELAQTNDIRLAVLALGTTTLSSSDRARVRDRLARVDSCPSILSSRARIVANTDDVLAIVGRVDGTRQPAVDLAYDLFTSVVGDTSIPDQAIDVAAASCPQLRLKLVTWLADALTAEQLTDETVTKLRSSCDGLAVDAALVMRGALTDPDAIRRTLCTASISELGTWLAEGRPCEPTEELLTAVAESAGRLREAAAAVAADRIFGTLDDPFAPWVGHVAATIELTPDDIKGELLRWTVVTAHQRFTNDPEAWPVLIRLVPDWHGTLEDLLGTALLLSRD